MNDDNDDRKSNRAVALHLTRKLLAAVCGLFGLAACAGNAYPPLATVADVDLGRYLGRWHEIARYPHRFEEGCSGVTADYALNPDGTIAVINSCRLDGEGGRVKQAKGKAKVVDATTNAKLKVSFFWPFYGDYWILKLDPDYRWVIVGEPSRNYVWILARTPQLDDATLKGLVEDIRGFGYDPGRLLFPR
ncbi:MAG: lipocalin family protein [Thermodesulfobacteriota bacterium]